MIVLVRYLIKQLTKFMKIMKIVKSLGFFLVLVVFGSQAQSLPNGWVLNAIHGPSQVGIVETIAVDLNRDGLMDVVSASIDDGHVRAYINQGGLQFEQQLINTDVIGAYRITATDINADGQTDFLVPSIETDEVTALIADNQAQPYGYRKQIIAGNVILPTDARAGDFNNDRLVDIVSVSFEDNQLLMHQQNSDGSFTTSVLSSSPQSPRKIVVADFNNDQLTDILVASSADNSVRLFSNTGFGNFNEILISDQLTGIRYIDACEITGNQLPSFVAGVTDANKVMMFTNNGSNSFSASVIDHDLPGADVVHCVNLDQDADLELISISRLHDSIYTQEISGPQSKRLIANRRDGYITATATILENNGEPVILTQAFFENRNLIYTLDKVSQEQVIWQDFPDGALYLEVGDVNNDGHQDLVYAAFRGDQVYWAEQTKTGYQIHTIYDAVDGPQSVKLADIDEDGDLDVFTAGAWDDRFYYHRNNGQGQFNTFVVSDSANNPARIDVMDVNGDSKLDLVTTSSLDDSLRWFEVNDVQFTETLIDDQLDGALALRVDDINLDGHEDILVGSYFGNSVHVFLNDGFGQFSKQQLSASKTKPTTILSDDVDNDGDIDIVFNASNDKSVWLLENNQGEFVESLITQSEEIVKDLALNNHGHNDNSDVVSVSDQTGIINISQNITGASFNTGVLTDTSFGISNIIPLVDNESNAPRFAIASNRNNSIQILSQRDLIFMSGFE